MASAHGVWSHYKDETEHLYQWQPVPKTYSTNEERALATITSPASFSGIIAVSGRTNKSTFEHDVLDNAKMTREVEQLAQKIKCTFYYPGWRACHAEMQLIAFHINYIEKFPEAFNYLQSRQRCQSISSAKKLDISASRNVCVMCHRFATCVYLWKGIEVRFFVDGQPDQPHCERCRTPITGDRKLRCLKCEHESLKACQYLLGFKFLTMNDLSNLRQALRWYVTDVCPGVFAEDDEHDDLPHIEVKAASALKYYSDFRGVITDYLREHGHTEVLSHLESIDWKFVRDARPACDGPVHIRKTMTSSPIRNTLDSNEKETKQAVERMIDSLTEQTAAVNLIDSYSSAHGDREAGINGGDSEEEALQENINSNIEQALDDVI